MGFDDGGELWKGREMGMGLFVVGFGVVIGGWGVDNGLGLRWGYSYNNMNLGDEELTPLT